MKRIVYLCTAAILLAFASCSYNNINGHDYVDLGLPSGLKWATCNVGADLPSEYGNYYAWGEIAPKESYNVENSLIWEQEIGEISGNSQYDVARAKWGSTWRMPTKAEFEELRKECEWEWTNEGGNDGYRVTGPNGNSIFLPAAGFCYRTSLGYAGSGGCYWSSMPYEVDAQNAYYLSFDSNLRSTLWHFRYFGISVRPVSGTHVTTKEVTGITETTAVCGGEVTDGGGVEITERGVCWSTNQNPTIMDSHTTDGSGTGSFTSNITGLSAGTTYYVRAYATNKKGIIYGEENQFIIKEGVITKEVTGITETTAVCGGEVTDGGGVEITERGVCWSTSQNPTIEDSHTTDGSGTGNFTSNITGLSASTTYYVRAYATNSYGTSYGALISFNTTSGRVNGHEYIDLGLPSGLKWATCNVGAGSPSEYGNYYAWGEIAPKESYNVENSHTWGQGIGEISGNPQYDAARANWGSTWRMPTKEEFEELLNNCTWTWTTQDGNYGYKVIGPNENSIFFPAADGRYGTSLIDAGSRGSYWSSTPLDSNTQNAYGLHFLSSYRGTHWFSRSYGQSVRPVSE